MDQDKANDLRLSVLNMCTIFTPLDVNCDGNVCFNDFYKRIKEVFLNFCKRRIVLSLTNNSLQTLLDESKREKLRETISLIFDAIDTDKSGEISLDELSNYFKSINVNDLQVACDAFAAMDTSGDETISKEGSKPKT